MTTGKCECGTISADTVQIALPTAGLAASGDPGKPTTTLRH